MKPAENDPIGKERSRGEQRSEPTFLNWIVGDECLATTWKEVSQFIEERTGERLSPNYLVHLANRIHKPRPETVRIFALAFALTHSTVEEKLQSKDGFQSLRDGIRRVYSAHLIDKITCKYGHHNNEAPHTNMDFEQLWTALRLLDLEKERIASLMDQKLSKAKHDGYVDEGRSR